MKNPRSVVRYVIIAAALCGLAAFLGGLMANLVRVRVQRAFADEAAALRQTPFEGLVPSKSRAHRPPADFKEDLQSISVPDAGSTADEKQALRRIETEMDHGSQAPVLRVMWQRLVPGRSPQTCDFTYFRDAQRIAYQVAGQPTIACAGVSFADFKGMTHGVGSSIAQDIVTLTRRNERSAKNPDHRL